jgi:hypothetical protein
VKVEFDVTTLKDSDIKKINEEIEEVLKKYL